MNAPIEIITLEDEDSPRRASYQVTLVALQQGYIVSTRWGGLSGKKGQEVYYREGLNEARQKFESIVASKLNKRHKKRKYQIIENNIVEEQGKLFD